MLKPRLSGLLSGVAHLASVAPLQRRPTLSTVRDELEVQKANYESMLRHFQLRNVQDHQDEVKHVYIVNADSLSSLEEELEQARLADASALANLSRFSLKRLTRRLHRLCGLRRRMLWHALCVAPFTPNGAITQTRRVLLLASFITQAVYLPFEAAYMASSRVALSSNTVQTSCGLTILFEVLFVVDLAMEFNTSFDERNKLIRDRKAIAKRYIRSWFAVDAVSSVPITLLRLLAGLDCTPTARLSSSSVLVFDYVLRIPRYAHLMYIYRFLWLTSVGRIGNELWSWLAYSRYLHLLQIMRMLLTVLLTTHYMACCWHLISASADSGSVASRGLVETYVSDFYYMVLLIQGQGAVSNVLVQDAYCIFVVLIGSMILAIVFGNVAMLVANFNATSTNYQRKMEAVFAAMNKLQLPTELRNRIHQYYEHLWVEYECLDGNIANFTRELSSTLTLEDYFVTQLLLRLEVTVFLPDDYIIRAGGVGQEFYMINRGVCEELTLVSEPGSPERSFCRSRRDLVAGDTFGEIALLVDCPQTTSVKATTHIEMCVLSRQSFLHVIARYPDDRKRVLVSIVANCIAMHAIPVAWEEWCAAAVKAEADRGGLHVNELTSRVWAEVLVREMDRRGIWDSNSAKPMLPVISTVANLSAPTQATLAAHACPSAEIIEELREMKKHMSAQMSELALLVSSLKSSRTNKKRQSSPNSNVTPEITPPHLLMRDIASNSAQNDGRGAVNVDGHTKDE
ncbi:TPA: hypothetical protein N0F65_003779 [Lagenidium giganteum]|uniref:Cyclic nucleotide-binding domain-containing protein n=1 Tax=Lagenidium giganteum TaxID=4803 RepID=A0AAV2YDX6_9STRA|nr:TPA: hypothetical protein N0F65_003779 [Lagenidium giganteum]